MKFPRFMAGAVGLSLGLVPALWAPDADVSSAATAVRVPFPAAYQTEFTALRTSSKPKTGQVATTYANARAASIKDPENLPYPYGSVFVFEWRAVVKDESGQVLRNEQGEPQPGPVTRIDVMRREAGYGDVYGDDRAGEWEFASYTPAGAPLPGAGAMQTCAQCHAKAAARDFVFRGRFPPLPGTAP